MKKKIIIISGTRADYGLLKNLTQLFQNDSDFETYLAATGSHLSEKHGKTINLIRQDGIKNILEVDLKIEGDRPLDISDSLAEGVKGFSKLYAQIKPDFIIVLGDRYELWSACMPATIFNIPIVHIHGGESTEGAIDEAVRHSITKLSHLHFCSHDAYKERIICMGEAPERVYTVGAIGLDRIKNMAFLPRKELENSLNITFAKYNVLCTFHPVTIDAEESLREITALSEAIEYHLLSEDLNVFITFPNADTYSDRIRACWEKLIQKFPQRVFGFVNLGDQRYLSLMKEVELILGNSSSGILEAPCLSKAIVNIGLRQQGRLQSQHIIQSNGTKEDIIKSIEQALSLNFQNELKNRKSIYGEGNTNNLIYTLIKNTSFKNIVLKKFNDGPRL